MLLILFLGTFIIGIFPKKDKDPMNLVLLRWYEIEEEMYGCPR